MVFSAVLESFFPSLLVFLLTRFLALVSLEISLLFFYAVSPLSGLREQVELAGGLLFFLFSYIFLLSSPPPGAV